MQRLHCERRRENAGSTRNQGRECDRIVRERRGVQPCLRRGLVFCWAAARLPRWTRLWGSGRCQSWWMRENPEEEPGKKHRHPPRKMVNKTCSVGTEGNGGQAHPQLQKAKRVVGCKLQRRDREPHKTLETIIITVPLAHVVQSLVQASCAVSCRGEGACYCCVVFCAI
jgi:hypothetical protein